MGYQECLTDVGPIVLQQGDSENIDATGKAFERLKKSSAPLRAAAQVVEDAEQALRQAQYALRTVWLKNADVIQPELDVIAQATVPEALGMANRRYVEKIRSDVEIAQKPLEGGFSVLVM
jgi:hypothetical protein